MTSMTRKLVLGVSVFGLMTACGSVENTDYRGKKYGDGDWQDDGFGDGGCDQDKKDHDAKDCCDPGGLGCKIETVEACVCAFDEYCCDTMWDQLCVDEAIGQCELECKEDHDKKDDGKNGDDKKDDDKKDCDKKDDDKKKNCCTPHEEAGCGSDAVEGCVCQIDAYCCTDTWDQQCVETAQTQCQVTCEYKKDHFKKKDKKHDDGGVWPN